MNTRTAAHLANISDLVGSSRVPGAAYLAPEPADAIETVLRDVKAIQARVTALMRASGGNIHRHLSDAESAADDLHDALAYAARIESRAALARAA